MSEGTVKRERVVRNVDTGRPERVVTDRIAADSHKASIDEVGIPGHDPSELSKTPPKETSKPEEEVPRKEWEPEYERFKKDRERGILSRQGERKVETSEKPDDRTPFAPPGVDPKKMEEEWERAHVDGRPPIGGAPDD